MIRKLQIWNFLSHKKTEIDFSPGVNVIVGPTDSGKSAIIKALRWVIQNRPSGDNMRSYWCSELEAGPKATAVTVHCDEGSVLRTKGDKENSYTLISGKSPITFNAVKTNVPKEIEDLLNLEEVNLQTQFAPHFLLTQSSGEVAQYFNKVAHLDKIDTASQNIRRWLKGIQQEIRFQEDTLTGLTTTLEQYKDLDEIEKRVVELEKLDRDIQVEKKDLEELNAICVELEKINKEVDDYSFLIELDKLVKHIVRLTDERKEVLKQADELNELIYSIEVCERELSRSDKEVKALEEQFHDELGKGKVCPLCNSVL